ncbi:unnamed protein product [Nezara viridula]|uniref:Uncharacterized protein n=1 Tax=Nezara viridula TaxID=85310 RepID=A0A9P0E7N2_NEZVI|nr:unnamed protein product [Nezara viridula]
MACTVTTCQAIFHGKCLNADESEFEALRALRKNWVCPKCEKARKNIQPTDKCLSPPRSAPQQQTVDSTSQLLLAAIKNLTEEVKGLKFSLDANANELPQEAFIRCLNFNCSSVINVQEAPDILYQCIYPSQSGSLIFVVIMMHHNGWKSSAHMQTQLPPLPKEITLPLRGGLKLFKILQTSLTRSKPSSIYFLAVSLPGVVLLLYNFLLYTFVKSSVGNPVLSCPSPRCPRCDEGSGCAYLKAVHTRLVTVTVLELSRVFLRMATQLTTLPHYYPQVYYPPPVVPPGPLSLDSPT